MIVSNADKRKLARILEDLIKTLGCMLEEKPEYFLIQNRNEAISWLDFLASHSDTVSLKSLEDEISNRLFYKYDVQISASSLDDQRVSLMKKYISLSNDIMK